MHFMGLLVIHTMAIEMTKEPWDEAKVKITGSAVTHHHGNYARAVHGPGELFHQDPRAIQVGFLSDGPAGKQRRRRKHSINHK